CTQPRGLFAVLDAARGPAVLNLLRSSNSRFESLYVGAAAELDEVAPYLVQIAPTADLLRALVLAGWGQDWGCYLCSNAPFEEIRNHWRRWLLVESPEGKPLYFRFYDPRVLRVFLPTCTHDESERFFGPVHCFLVEDSQPGLLLHFARHHQEFRCDVVPLDLRPPDV
ncbi:MAG: DUF4123 domain-containing protein, partial [Acidobacteria bacterium]|nr:DUF4123 domain-containing protein [Acidobacteriota bacterium]